MDKIIITNLRLCGILGINPDERVNKQDILVNLILFTDISKPALSDIADDAVDYKTVKNRVIQHVEQSADLLVEKLVSDLARMLLSEFPAVERVRVRVEKPGALRFADSVGIEIERIRADFD